MAHVFSREFLRTLFYRTPPMAASEAGGWELIISFFFEFVYIDEIVN